MPTEPNRTATQRGTPGAPPHPAPPSTAVRPKRGRPAGPQPPRLPRYLFDAPPLPRLDEATRRFLSTLANPADRVASAASYIMCAVGAGATIAEIETEISVTPGSLVGELIGGRLLMLRYSAALVERAEGFDRRAQTLLAAVAGGAVRTPAVRATLDYANTLRCMAEAARRQSEGLLRKATLAADKDASQARSRLQRLVDAVVGTAGASLPATARELTVTTDAPLEAARQLLPQLQAALAESTGGQRRLIGGLIESTERYIRRLEGAATPPRAMSAAGSSPSPQEPAASLQPPAAPPVAAPDSPELVSLRDSLQRARHALEHSLKYGRPPAVLRAQVQACAAALFGALKAEYVRQESVLERAPRAERGRLEARLEQLVEEFFALEDELGEATVPSA